MSSNHTRVLNSEWEAMQHRIASTEAYVINRQAEATRIANLIESRRREIESIHQANQRAIQQSVSALTEMFNESAGVVRGRINTQLRTQADAFGSELQGIRNELANTSARLSVFDRRIDALATTYNDIFQEYANQEQSSNARANLVLNEIDRLLQLIDELSPQRFSPVEYANLVSLRESIRVNLNAGDNQAATLVSQNSILQATRLLARLQLMNDQYNTQVNAIRENATRTQRRIEELSSKDGVLTAEIGGVIEEYDYDISFWSHGTFDSLVSEFHRLQNLLDGNLTLEQLNQVGADLDQLGENIAICDANARHERTGALIAADAALRLHNGLSNSNWNLETSGYVADDEREPYAMTYTDAAGNTVSVVISPESPEAPGIFMEVFSDDEELASMTKDGIHASLEDEGLTIASREQRDDCHLNPDSETFIDNAVAEARETLEQRR